MANQQSADEAAVINPNDNQDLPGGVTVGIYVGGTGDVRVSLQRDATPVTFSAVPAGSVLPIRARRVHTTGTTATNLLALY